MVGELSRGGAVIRPCKSDVEVGKFYRISHQNLPPRTPSSLKHIQVVLVTEKANMKVTVKFPSIESLKKPMSLGIAGFYASMDSSFIMGIELAKKVLLSEVAKPDIYKMKDFTTFWLLDASLLTPKAELEVVSPKLLCSSTIEYQEEEHSEVDKNEYQEEEHDEVDKNEAMALVKVENKNEAMALVKLENDCDFDDSKGLQYRKKYRWSEKSFQNGKGIILDILKENKATADKPMSRAALRRSAVKQIGNTGLLDYILKDIVGNLTPDGGSRFQRSYNSAGVMVYWYESAEAVDVKKHAGVTGCCSVKCICSEELELVKNDLANIKRELDETYKKLREIRAGDVRR